MVLCINTYDVNIPNKQRAPWDKQERKTIPHGRKQAKGIQRKFTGEENQLSSKCTKIHKLNKGSGW